MGPRNTATAPSLPRRCSPASACSARRPSAAGAGGPDGSRALAGLDFLPPPGLQVLRSIRASPRGYRRLAKGGGMAKRVVIVGAGPGGLAAAMLLARAG